MADVSQVPLVSGADRKIPTPPTSIAGDGRRENRAACPLTPTGPAAKTRADAVRIVTEALVAHFGDSYRTLAATDAERAVAALQSHPKVLWRLAHPGVYR